MEEGKEDVEFRGRSRTYICLLPTSGIQVILGKDLVPFARAKLYLIQDLWR